MSSVAQPTLAVIGGTGIYDLEGISELAEKTVDTPYGQPSGPFITGKLGTARLVFLARHGKGHIHMPHEINYRANIYGMKKLGVTRILSITAVGSMRADIAPGDMVVVDQFIDRTQSRAPSFFGQGLVAHVSLATPYCPQLSTLAAQAAGATGAKVHRGGTYLCIEGPQFSTRAESNLYRHWGVDVIGMTNLPEVRLAREAEICFTTVALTTDYDCWHEEQDAVNVDSVLEVLKQNSARAKQLVSGLAERVAGQPQRTCDCERALAGAIMTDPARIPTPTLERTQLLVEKYLT
jgi:5'-methylthioadenosine phosphorylase